MEFNVHDVVPDISQRSAVGRVIVNPPDRRGPLRCRTTGKIYMCCSRAFLTEEAYLKHASDVKEHGKAVDFSKFPKPSLDLPEIQALSKGNGSLEEPARKRKKLKAPPDNHGVDGGGINNEEVVLRGSELSAGPTKGKICDICGFKISFSNLKRHLRTAHAKNGIKCEHCPCSYLHLPSLLRHKRRDHGIFSREMKTAAAKPLFKTAAVAKAKKQLIASAKPQIVYDIFKRKQHACQKCGKQFPSRTRLADHMNSHTGARPHKCEQCGFRFTQLCNLKRHMRNGHPKSTEFRCNTCKCNFATGQLLVRHNKVMHPTKLKIKKLPSPVKSEAKEKPQENEEATVNHSDSLPKDVKEKPPAPNASGFYKCSICGKLLVTAQTWIGHMRIHKNLKPYKCNFCEMSFRLSSTRRNHKCHSGGSFKCEFCSCSYNAANSRNMHVKVCLKNPINVKNGLKSPVKPLEEESKKNQTSSTKPEAVTGFKCNLCGAVVRTLEDFELHKNEHSGVPPTQCNLCLAKFSAPVAVRKHKQNAHGDASVSIHRCPFCCCRYKASTSLFQHLSKQHAMSTEDWDYDKKSIKPEARTRIQLRLCKLNKPKTTPVPDAPRTEPEIKKNIAENDTSKLKTSTNVHLNKPYKCDLCPCSFLQQASIYKHKKVAHGTGKHRCSDCSCRYRTERMLKEHQQKIHKPVSSESSKVETQASARVSEASQDSQGNVECDLCGAKMASRNGLTRHKLRCHSQSGKFKCSHCTCMFETQRGLDIHLSNAHGVLGKTKQQKLKNRMEPKAVIRIGDMFECDLCHLKFTHRSTVIIHKRRSHFNSGKFKCNRCPCTFISVGSLQNHMKHHEKMRKMMKSKSKTKSVDPLPEIQKAHVENVNADAEVEKDETMSASTQIPERIKCDQCHLMIGKKHAWRHKKVAHSGGDYKCSDCPCTFQTHMGLRIHTNLHRKLNRKVPLKKVQTSQLNESAKSFSGFNKNFLKIRSMFSSTKRTAASIPTSPDKKSPVKQSTPSKTENYPLPRSKKRRYRHKCDKCGISFAKNLDYIRHLESAHVVGGIPCGSCSCAFRSAGNLGAHRRIYHPNNDETLKEVTVTPPKSKSPSKVKPVNVEGNGTVPKNKLSNSDVTLTDNNADGQPEVYSEIRTRQRAAEEKKPTNGSAGDAKSVDPTPEVPEEPKHQCSWCLKTFGTASILRHHYLSHTKPETCDQCNMGFRSKAELIQHQQNSHNVDLKFQCHICTCRFATSLSMKAHIRMSHIRGSGSVNFAPDVVIENVGGVPEDNSHLIPVDQGHPLQASENGFDEESEPIVQGLFYGDEDGEFDHGQGTEPIVTNDPQDEGEEIYEDSVPIISQRIMPAPKVNGTHADPDPPKTKPGYSPKSRPIKCPYCTETCYGPENLRLHVESHQKTSNGNVKCTKCTYEFPTKEQMLDHLEVEHSGMYKCAYCPCSMKSEPSLRSHFLKYHT